VTSIQKPKAQLQDSEQLVVQAEARIEATHPVASRPDLVRAPFLELLVFIAVVVELGVSFGNVVTRTHMGFSLNWSMEIAELCLTVIAFVAERILHYLCRVFALSGLVLANFLFIQVFGDHVHLRWDLRIEESGCRCRRNCEQGHAGSGGYSQEKGVAVLSGATIMGETVPPSLPMIVLGSVTTLSIGTLFLAGLLPAAFIVLAFVLPVTLWLPGLRR
jgi:hypothetical protein